MQLVLTHMTGGRCDYLDKNDIWIIFRKISVPNAI
jgi:hypothetical protein